MIDIKLDFASDLLRGADAIAEFLLGDKNKRRSIYHLSSSSRLPAWKHTLRAPFHPTRLDRESGGLVTPHA